MRAGGILQRQKYILENQVELVQEEDSKESRTYNLEMPEIEILPEQKI